MVSVLLRKCRVVSVFSACEFYPPIVLVVCHCAGWWEDCQGEYAQLLTGANENMLPIIVSCTLANACSPDAESQGTQRLRLLYITERFQFQVSHELVPLQNFLPPDLPATGRDRGAYGESRWAMGEGLIEHRQVGKQETCSPGGKGVNSSDPSVYPARGKQVVQEILEGLPKPP